MGRSHAERIFACLAGREPPSPAPVQREVVASWARCVQEYRLEPTRVDRPHILTASELKGFRDPAGELLAAAQPELDRLFRRLGGENYVVLFTDTHSVTVDFRVAEPIRADARRSGLYLGAIWDERQQGTNGVGTCLSIARPVSIVRDDHFAAHNTGLTCTVAPVHGPSGEVAGVLDVSTPRATDHRRERLVLDILLDSARRIESRLFRRRYRDVVVIRLSQDREFLDAAEECLLALDERGRIVAADRPALRLLRRWSGGEVLDRPVASVLRVGERTLLATAQGGAVDLADLTGSGGELFARVLPAARSTAPAQRPAEPVRPPRATTRQPNLERLAGADPGMARAVATARRLLDVGLPVLLLGETGTGKGALAAALHRAGRRADRPFVALNCAALPETLIESELFGYQPGAFTGAARAGSRGKLLEANGGTLFLDEIGDMPLALQTRLLRALSEAEVTPLGGGRPVPIDIAVIAATHRPLEQLVAEGRFREDLYHRLAGAVLRLPPLRARADRARLVAEIFAEEVQSLGSRAELAPATKALLDAYFWPGNIRQLRHAVRHAVAVCDGAEILPQHLPEPLRGPDGTGEGRAQALRLALDHHGWNVSAAARTLGVSRATLHRRIRNYEFVRPDRPEDRERKG